MAVFTFHADEKGRGYYLHSAYNPDFIADLKAAIGWDERKWLPDKKLWWIEKYAFEDAKKVCLHYGSVIVRSDEPDDPERKRQEEERRRQAEEERRERDQESRRRVEERARQDRERWERDEREREERRRRVHEWKSGQGNDSYAVLHLRPDAPIEVVRAAYRALALLHHPDIGGDVERMKKVNAAFDAICLQKGVKK